MLKKIIPFVLIAGLLILGCSDEEKSPLAPTDVNRVIYVVNSLAMTISVIDLEADTVYNDAYGTGQWPAEIDFIDGQLFIVNSGDNTIQIIAVSAGLDKTIELGDNRSPSFFEMVGENLLAVSNWVAGTVSFVDIEAETVVDEIPVGKGPWGMTAYGDKLFVGYSNYDPGTYTWGQGRVAVVDIPSRTLEDSLDVGTNPGLLFIDQQNELNVVCIGNYLTEFGSVWTIDPANLTITGNFDIGKNPAQEAMNSDGLVYLAAGGELDANWQPLEGYILSYDSNTETVIHGDANPIVIEEPTSILGIALDSEGVIYASSYSTDEVLVLDEAFNIVKRYAVGDGPERMIYVEK